jgi:hypothetical protein
MSFDDYLREQRNSTAVAFDEFVRKYSQPGYVHLFFEGADDPSFYTDFVEGFVDTERIRQPYNCGGKDGVYEVFKKVNSRLKVETSLSQTIRVLYFVDRDHSDIDGRTYITDERIYITDYYSIENHIVDNYMLRKVWEQYFHFEGEKIPDFEGLEIIFTRALQDFHKSMCPIMAWTLITRKHKERPNLDQLQLDNVIQVDQNGSVQERISRKYSDLHEALEKMCNAKTPIGAEEEIKDMISELESISEAKKYVRGKYEIWFFSKFIKKLAERFQAEKGLKFKLRSEQQLSESGMLLALAPRARIPDSLKIFLETHLNNFPKTASA